MIRAAAFAGLLGLVTLSIGTSSAAPKSSDHLVPEHIPSDTRTELTARMGQHGVTMSSLVRAVVLLDRPTIRTLAGRIADEEILAQTGKPRRDRRPLPLPPEFPAEQTRLSLAARDLAVAAKDGGDDRALAERFAALTSACVTCHSVYLHGRPEPGPLGPPGK